MPTNLTQKQILILGGGVLAAIVIGVVVMLSFRSSGSSAGALDVTIWGTDSERAFNEMIQGYTGPGSGTSAKIRYVQIDPAQYQSRLLSAFAAGTGPDMFEIPNRDLAQWQNLATPIPATLTKTFNAVTLQTDFPDIVTQDFVSGGSIYALPLSIDTLAMIYNKDLFNTAGIVTAPTTWEALQTDLPQLRKMNDQGQVLQAAVALGGSRESIVSAPDIVFLLMMQNGTRMVSSDGTTASFATGSNGADSSGPNAFNYYLQFANAGSASYTWNDGLGDAVDAFAQGKVAVIFGYSSDVATIKQKSPFLNYGVAAMPQPASAAVAVNYARYNGLAVSKYSKNVSGAWQFIINLTTSATNENIYATDTGAPPALRSLIAADLSDPSFAVFASQALTAKSWHESNSEQIDTIMDTAIKNVLHGAADSRTAIMQAQSSINALGQ